MKSAHLARRRWNVKIKHSCLDSVILLDLLLMTVKLVNHLRKACSITNSLQPDLYVRNGIKRSLVKLSQAHSGRDRWNIRKDILLMSYAVLWIESPGWICFSSVKLRVIWVGRWRDRFITLPTVQSEAFQYSNWVSTNRGFTDCKTPLCKWYVAGAANTHTLGVKLLQLAQISHAYTQYAFYCTNKCLFFYQWGCFQV